MNQVEVAAALQQAAAPFLAVQGEEAPATSSEQRTFTLMSAADVLAMERPRWRVKGMLPSVGLAAIFGQPGSAKTFVALDLAFAVAEGTDWFDMRTEAAFVVYINLESTGGLQKRLSAWQFDRQRVVSDNVRFIVEPFHILDDVDALACGLPTGAVVFLDTLNAAAPGLDENSSLDMGKILEAAKNLQRLTGGLVVLVHHTGKDANRGLRGHSSLLAALDAAVEVSRNGDARHWRVTKSKEGEDGTRRGFRLKPVCIGYDEDGEPETSCVVEPDDTVQEEEKPLTPALRYALESLTKTLDEKGTESVHLDDWRPTFYEECPADSVAGKRQAFNRARKDLLERGIIGLIHDNYSVTKRDKGTARHDASRPKTDSVTVTTVTPPFRVCHDVTLHDGGPDRA